MCFLLSIEIDSLIAADILDMTTHQKEIFCTIMKWACNSIENSNLILAL